MDKKKLKIAGLSIAGIFLVAVIIALISAFFWEDSNMEGINMYFYNPTTKKIESENVYIQKAADNVMLQDLLNRFFDFGPQKTNLVKTANNKTEIYNVEVKDNIYKVEFSDSYKELTPKEEILFKCSFVWSLTELDFIEKVEFSVKDESTENSKIELGVFDRTNVILNMEIEPRRNEAQNLKLYFPDFESMKLVEETKVAVVDTQRRSKYLLDELLNGTTAFPDSIELRGIEEREQTCYVNFNKGFLSLFASLSEEQEKLLIYSIVNTLTDKQNQIGIDNDKKITKVQFLVENLMIQEQDYSGKIDVTQPLERNDDLLK